MAFDLIESRRRILTAVASKQRIPPEYQEVQYIYSHTACFSLDYVLQSENFKIETRIEVNPSSGDKTVFGNKRSAEDAGDSYFRIGSYSKKWFIYNNKTGSGSNTNAYSASYNSSRVFTLTFEFRSSDHKKIITCQGTTTSATNNYSIINGRKLGVFFDGLDNTNTFYANMYYARFYQDGVKIIDLIPCYRKSDHEVGMYDIVNNVFYTNAFPAETNYFTAGPDV